MQVLAVQTVSSCSYSDTNQHDICGLDIFVYSVFTLSFTLYLLVRPETIVFGRTYVLLEFIYLFFFSRNVRTPSADRREILHDARSCVQFYNPIPGPN